MIKPILAALVTMFSISSSPVWGDDSITLEERICFSACTEIHDKEYGFVPFIVFMSKCLPMCIERIECDVKVKPPVCIDKGPGY